MTDVRDWIASHAKRAPHDLAQIDHATGARFTYGEMNDRVSRIAGHFRTRAGIKIGDVVAVLANNTSQTFDIDFACGRAGAIFFPMNTRLAAPELAFQIDDAQPRLIFVGAEYRKLAEAAVKAATTKPLLIDMRPGEHGPDLEAIAADGPHFTGQDQRKAEDGWTLIYSSGTTGRPKGVLHTHGGVTMQAIGNCVPLGLGRKARGLTVLPLFHISGLNVFAHAIFYAGGCQTTMARFDPAEMLAVMSDPAYGITHMCGVPTMFEMMAHQPGFASADLSHVEGAFVGGAPSTLALLETYAAKGMPLVQGYGLTETGPTLTVLNSEDATAKIGSAGTAIMHVDLKLVNDAGEEVPSGQSGEVLARGPSVITRYFNRPEAQETDFLEGWLRTGDIGRMDEDGYLYIVDRKKDMYISGGENVYPAEVENCIAGLDGVRQVAVLGIQHPKWGETGAACIVRDPTSTLNAEDVTAYCEGKLARYKIPKSITFMETLPLGGSGKVLKGELRTLLDTNPTTT